MYGKVNSGHLLCNKMNCQPDNGIIKHQLYFPRYFQERKYKNNNMLKKKSFFSTRFSNFIFLIVSASWQKIFRKKKKAELCLSSSRSFLSDLDRMTDAGQVRCRIISTSCLGQAPGDHRVQEKQDYAPFIIKGQHSFPIILKMRSVCRQF